MGYAVHQCPKNGHSRWAVATKGPSHAWDEPTMSHQHFAPYGIWAAKDGQPVSPSLTTRMPHRNTKPSIITSSRFVEWPRVPPR